MRDYVIAAALGNGKVSRFVPLVRRLRGGFIVFHFMVITLALNFPVMFAIARLEPWEFYSRLYGAGFAAMLDESGFSLPEAAPDDNEAAPGFNEAMYAGGYGRRVMLPMLAFSFMLTVILQLAFYFLAAFFLGLSRMTSSSLPYRDRFGIFVFSSTLPAIGAAILGLWLPTVHFVAFYFAEIILAFAVSRAYDAEEFAAAI